MNAPDFFFVWLTEKQLGLIMTAAALAIPMADKLPTHNARKTCAGDLAHPGSASRVSDCQPRSCNQWHLASHMLCDVVSMASLVRRARRYANNEMKVHIFSSLSSRFVVLIFFSCSLGDS
jgi:hypothetical protein